MLIRVKQIRIQNTAAQNAFKEEAVTCLVQGTYGPHGTELIHLVMPSRTSLLNTAGWSSPPDGFDLGWGVHESVAFLAGGGGENVAWGELGRIRRWDVGPELGKGAELVR